MTDMIVVWDSGDRSFAITTDLPDGLDQIPLSAFLLSSFPDVQNVGCFLRNL